MDFVNETRWQARLFTGFIGEGVKAGWVVARATFRWDPYEETLRPAEEPWPVFTEVVKTDHAVFPSDESPFRRGCDLVVVGSVRLARPTSVHRVTVTAGAFTRSLLVQGDRTWVRRGSTLVASAPVPFTEMPLDWSRAFGGTAPDPEGRPIPHVLNPVGIGLYYSEEAAEGRPLPNIEDPRSPIARWDDRPAPAGWAPVRETRSWQLAEWVRERAARGGAAPSGREITTAALRMSDGASPPATVMPELCAGNRVSLGGMEGRDMGFRVPVASLVVQAQAGSERIERPLAPVGLWVLVPQRLVVVTLQGRFRYGVRPREKRVATLRGDGASMRDGAMA